MATAPTSGTPQQPSTRHSHERYHERIVIGAGPPQPGTLLPWRMRALAGRQSPSELVRAKVGLIVGHGRSPGNGHVIDTLAVLIRDRYLRRAKVILKLLHRAR